jgi:hypothetical protein
MHAEGECRSVRGNVGAGSDRRNSVDDQTEQSWLNTSPHGQLGTAIMVVPTLDPERGYGHKVLDFPDLTYADAEMRAHLEQAVSLKWVPHFIADYATLRISACGAACTKSCVQPGCICDKATKMCVKAK